MGNSHPETQAQRIVGIGARAPGRLTTLQASMSAAANNNNNNNSASSDSASTSQQLQQMRHHKHLYIVLTSSATAPPIRYLGHPGRGPLLFHSRHFLGDAANSDTRAEQQDSVENVEGFQLRAAVSVREPPQLLPAALAPSSASGGNFLLRFNIDVGPEVSVEQPLLVEVFTAAQIGFTSGGVNSKPSATPAAAFGNVAMLDLARAGDPGGAARAAAAFAARGFRLTGGGSALSAMYRPVSPFGVGAHGAVSGARVFARVLTEGGTRVSCQCDMDAAAVFGTVPVTRRDQGRPMPSETPIAFRLSWGDNLNIVLGISTRAEAEEAAAAVAAGIGRRVSATSALNLRPPPAAPVAAGEFQLLSCWEAPATAVTASAATASGASSSSSASSPFSGAPTVQLSTTAASKLKPYASRFLSQEGQCFRVDDVYDLAGDDDGSPSTAASAGSPGFAAGSTAAVGDQQSQSPTRGGAAAAGVGGATDDQDDAVAPESIAPAASHDGGSECVVCLDNPRNALLLPCRHLCICTDCAPMLRQQSNNKCPVCRGPIKSVIVVG